MVQNLWINSGKTGQFMTKIKEFLEKLIRKYKIDAISLSDKELATTYHIKY